MESGRYFKISREDYRIKMLPVSMESHLIQFLWFFYPCSAGQVLRGFCLHPCTCLILAATHHKKYNRKYFFYTSYSSRQMSLSQSCPTQRSRYLNTSTFMDSDDRKFCLFIICIDPLHFQLESPSSS